MKRRRIDSVLLGGALALSGVMQRRVDDLERAVERRDELAERLAATPAPPPAPPASIPGMPLPTGYGLQVRGPLGESIVLPVCLPPGFELDSMMLCPEFLPRVEASPVADAAPSFAPSRSSSPAPHAAAPAAPVRHAAPPARPARPEPATGAGRLDGVLQLVFGADQRFTSSLEHSEDTVSSEPARGSPALPKAGPALPKAARH
jgi:hypothetical protein